MRFSCLTPRIQKSLLAMGLLSAGLSSTLKLWAKGQFEVPAGCGEREQFETSVRERMGGDSRTLLETLDLSIERNLDTYTLFMRVGTESRQLEDGNCEDLFRAAVVVAVALWVAPTPSQHQTEGQTLAPASTPSSNPDANAGLPNVRHPESNVSPPSGQLQPVVVQPARPAKLFRLSGEFGLNGGLQPRFSPAFGLRGALDFESFGVASTLRFLPPNRHQDGNGRGVSVMAIGGHLTGYFKPVSRLGMQAGVSTYYLQGTGIGSDATSTASVVSFGPLLGLWAILWQSDSFFLSLGAEGQLELLRPRFEILDYGEVFRVSPLVWGSNLAAGYSFR